MTVTNFGGKKAAGKSFYSRRGAGRCRRPILEELEQRVLLDGSPDLQLIIEGVQLPTELHAGETFTLLARKVNAGGAAVPAGTGFYYTFFLSADNQLDVGDTPLVLPGVGYNMFDDLGIAAGETWPAGGQPAYAIALYVPLSVAAGNYYLIGKIDSSNVINEGTSGGENNNVTATATAAVQVTDNIIYYADFEGGSQQGFNLYGLGVSGVQNLWHKTTNRAFTESHNSATSLYYGWESFWNYNTNARNGGYAVSPLINLADASGSISLSFAYFLTTENSTGYDLATVQIVTDTPGYSSGVIAANNQVGLEDPSGTWLAWEGDISSYAGSAIRLVFTFDTVDSQDNSFEGWYIDDIVIRGNGSNLWPDLQVAIEDVQAAGSLIEGDTFTVKVRQSNTGAWDVAAGTEFSMKYYLSLDGTLDAGDLLVSAVNPAELINAGGLAAGASWPAIGLDPFSMQLLVPNRIPAGDYYVIAQIDSQNAIYENYLGGEDNNLAVTASPVLHVVYPSVPDLQVTLEEVVASGNLNYGETFIAKIRQTNTGDVAVAPGTDYHFAFYLSLDDQLDGKDILLSASNPADLVYSGGLAVGEINPAPGSDPLSITLVIPENIPGRTYYVIAKINSADEVYEGYIGAEANNTDVSGSALVTVIPGLPDLQVALEDVQAAATLYRGDKFTAGGREFNTGGGDIAPGTGFHFAFYISLDNQLDGSDLPIAVTGMGYNPVEILGLNAWESRPAEGQAALTLEFTVPDNVQTGSYYLIAVIDSDNEIEEIAGGGEDNNIFVTATAVLNVVKQDDFFFADFEDETSQGFETVNYYGQNLWHLTYYRNNEAGHSGWNSLYYGREGYYNYNTGSYTSGYVVSPEIDLRGALDTALLSFNYHLQTSGNPSYDSVRVEVASLTQEGVSVVVASNQTNGGLVETPTGWTSFRCDISAFAGDIVQIRFGFLSLYGSGNYEGWLVDDVAVRAVTRVDWPDLQVSIEEVEAGAGMHSGDVFTAKVRETNAGTFDVAAGEEYVLVFFLSADDKLDGNDFFVASVNAADLINGEGLAAGQSRPAVGLDPRSIQLILPDGVPLGQYYLLAYIDVFGEVFEGFDGNEDNNAAATAAPVINITLAPPVITQLSAAPSTLEEGDGTTLTALGVSDADGTVTKVEFYRDVDGNGILNVGTDALLGSDLDGSDGWSWSGVPGFTAGTWKCFARAQDDDGNWSAAASVTITVNPPDVYELILTKSSLPFTFADATSDSVIIIYGGSGQAVIRFTGLSADGSDIDSIVITGATGGSSLSVLTPGSSPVASVSIAGTGFKTLEIQGDLGALDIGITPGKSFKNLIVGGALGDVTAPDVKKISLIQADSIVGIIEAQEIKTIVVLGDIQQADIEAVGSKGKIKELRVGGDVTDSIINTTKGISQAYITGDVLNSYFLILGDGGKLGKFYISGGVSDSIIGSGAYKASISAFYIGGGVADTYFAALGEKGKLGKFYIGGDVTDTDFDSATSIAAIYVGYDFSGAPLAWAYFSGNVYAGTDLKKMYCTGSLDGYVEAGGGIKDFFADSISADGVMVAYGKISKAVFEGPIYGQIAAGEIKKAGTNSDYFRDPDTDVQDSCLLHLASTKPLNLKYIWDVDGNMIGRV